MHPTDVAGTGPVAEGPQAPGVADRDAGPVPPGTSLLLGVLAYGELSAFDRMAADARYAPTLSGRMALSQMAAAEMGHFRRLAAQLASLGVPVEEAMAPFVAPLEAWHDSTAPHSWLESLVKAYVGDGLAADFYREIAEWLDPATRDLVFEVLSDTGHSAFAVREVRRACAADPRLTGPLALWGRRLLGEAITQAQYVVAEHDELADLIIKGSGDLAGIGALFRRLQMGHTERMKSLGLA
ncbi:ferritin-like fold-containing protein [Nakamurella endophytica]|uniref:Hydroxylase n=1 Tax=Nakamurella endophytica TaxID=1748367 RepID=A0A917WCW9_9ACTN|nr:ferritin-like fold-containing protein [Nakamurella endophytica]GGL95732.1 hydroxylase [Nakamurella endophytica]